VKSVNRFRFAAHCAAVVCVLICVLGAAVWGNVPINAGFWDNYGQHPADPPMQFRVCTDGQWLYLAVELSDPDPGRYNLENRGKDECDFRHETLEIFVAPFADQPVYYQFALEPGGSDFDNMAGGNHTDHNYSWQHAQKITEDGWVAELALPLAEVGRTAGVKPGDFLALNVCRETKGPMPLHCWSPTGGGFHNRSAFGELVIGSFSAAAVATMDALDKQLLGAETGTDASDSRKTCRCSRLAAIPGGCRACRAGTAAPGILTAWPGGLGP